MTNTYQQPEYLKEYLDNLNEPAHIHVIQTRSEELSKGRLAGDIVLHPGNKVVATVVLTDNNESGTDSRKASFTPISFFREWMVRNFVDGLPIIKDRSRDPDSEIARRAKKFNGEYEGVEYCEILNYICFLHILALYDTPVVLPVVLPVTLSFALGNYKNGLDFGNLIALRKTPMHLCLFDLYSRYVTDEVESSYSLSVTNPEFGPDYIVEEDMEKRIFNLKEIR